MSISRFSTYVEIDTDEILDQITTDELLAELNLRGIEASRKGKTIPDFSASILTHEDRADIEAALACKDHAHFRILLDRIT